MDNTTPSDELSSTEQTNSSLSFQPMAIQSLLISNEGFQSTGSNSLNLNSYPNPIQSPRNQVPDSSRLDSGRMFSPETSNGFHTSQTQSPRFTSQPTQNSNSNPSALLLSQYQATASPVENSNPVDSNTTGNQRPPSPRSNNSSRPGFQNRDETNLSYDLSRLVTPSGAEISRSASLSPSQVPLPNFILGSTATQRLPSISPIDLENNLTQSPMESPITRDLNSPSTRSSFNPAPRSPTSRRLRTSQDALTRRYFRQAMYGCSQDVCSHAFCASNPNFVPRDIKEATALSITLSQHGEEYICPEVAEFDPCDNSLFPVPLQKSLRNDLARDPRKRHRNIKSWAGVDEISNLDILPNLQLDSLYSFQKEAQESGNYDKFTQIVYTVFSRINLVSASFSQKNETLRKVCPVDIDHVRMGYEFISKECPKSIAASILSGTATLFDKLKLGLEVIREQHLPALLIVLLNPLLMDPSNHHEILPKFCDMFSGLCDKYVSILANYIVSERSTQDIEKEKEQRGKDFQHIVSVFQQFITMRLLVKADQSITPNKDEFVMKATTCLGILYKINEEHSLISYTEFYNDAVNEQIEIKEDFPRFRSRNGFSFCNFPFILNPATKSDILKVESMFQMRQELQDAFFRALFVGVNSPYLVLEIRRDFIIRDALLQLSSKSPQDLKKQLRVQFVGEEGVDEGGVQKEFFQLLIREMFDPKYGMFSQNEGSRLFWFNPNPLDDEIALDEYRLIGRLIGLAIYNSVILDLHFPAALYKKLMGNPVGLDDLQEFDQSLGQGLKGLLNYTDDVEAAYGWSFQIDYEAVGTRFKAELKPNGANLMLNNENKDEFVQLYVDFMLNKSIERQFKAFKEGFDHVCAGSAIQLFRHEEVEQLVCGSSDLDFEALERVTQYDGGYTTTTPVITYFWKIVHSFTEAQKKMLLFFATGSDRVPIGGLSKLQFVIAKNGSDSDRLPTSHTCFNVLLLCEYSSLEKLQERLCTAISNAEGFGMI